MSKLLRIVLLLMVVAAGAAGWWWHQHSVRAVPQPAAVEAALPAELIQQFQSHMAALAEREKVFAALAGKAGLTVPGDDRWQQQFIGLQALLTQIDSDRLAPTAANRQSLDEGITLLQARTRHLDVQNRDLESLLREQKRADKLQQQWRGLSHQANAGMPPALALQQAGWRDEAGKQTQAMAFVAAAQLWQHLSDSLTSWLARVTGTIEARDQALEHRSQWKSVSGHVESAATAKAEELFQNGSQQLQAGEAENASASFVAATAAWQAAWRADLVRLATPAMVAIPAGHFRMGDIEGKGKRDQQPVHDVAIDAFLLAATEITFEQYGAYARLADLPLPDAHGWGEGRRPVINISWQDAHDYAAWLAQETGRAFRLPTEAEWEYAARAGTDSAYAWGEDMTGQMANCEGCSRWGNDRSLPVGSFRPNAFGLYDMSGNVWEWTEDCYRSRYDAPPVVDVCRERVLRGGSWADLPPVLKVANRSHAAPGYASDRIGFRLAQDH